MIHSGTPSNQRQSTRTALGSPGLEFSASAPSDVTVTGTQFITFNAGDDSKTFTLTVIGDNLAEGNEVFALITTLSGVTNVPLAVTIADDDEVRTLTVTGPSPATVAEGAGATFTVGITGTAFTNPTAVTWTVTPGTAAASDFVAVTDSIMFPTVTTFTVNTVDDSLIESAETFTVQISVADPSADGGTGIGAATGDISITDNDTAGLVVSSSAVSVPEGGTETYTVRLMTQPTTAAGTVTVTVAGGSGGTVIMPVSETLMFTAANWNTPQRVAVMAHADAAVGDTVMLTHTVSGTGEYANADGMLNATVTVSIVAVPVVAAATDKELQELVLPEVARAVVGQQMSALVERVGSAGSAIGNLPSFNLNGQSSFAGVAAANAQALANGDGDGGLDAKTLLRDFDFVMPLRYGAGAANGSSGVGSIAFWGSADYRDFSGEDGDSDWDGGVTSLHFGVDGKVRGDLLAGVMVSYSDSSSEYSQVAGGNTQKGDYELDLTSVSPYLNWQLGDGASAWASVSYGSGEVEVKPDGADATTNDVSMQSFAFGGSKRLLQQGKRELSLKADVFVAEAEVEGNAAGGIAEDLEVDANRVRVALAWREPPGGVAKWKPAFDLGLRHDGGDGRTGAGVELGGAWRFYDAAVGLTIEGRARALVGHTGDHRGWGVGGLMRVESGADGQGLSLSVTPSYGNADVDLYGDSGVDSLGLWDNGLAAAADSADDLSARLNAEVGYGLLSKLTPYSAMRVGDSSRDYRLGMRWSAASRLDLDLSARRIDDGDADNLIALEGRLRF